MVPGYLIASLLLGSLFALMAIGLTLTYMTTKVPNFAYGSFVTIGLYTSYTLFWINHINPYLSSLIAFVVSGLASVVMYLIVLRPLARRGSPLVSQMIATFGVDVGFIGVFGIYTDYLQGKFGLSDAPQFYQISQDDFMLFGVHGINFVAPVAVAVIVVMLFLLLTRTKFGIAMRASVENASLARVLGINVERVYIIAWMLAGGFAGLAGALYTVGFPGGTSTGSDLIVEIFASSILGGLTSMFGAVFGGLVIGGSEDVVTTNLALGFGYVGTGLVVLLLFLAGILSVRRSGRASRIFGVILLILGVYMVAEIITGFTSDFFVSGLINGYGPNVTPYQKALPLLIMVATLLILPTGIVSLNLRKLLRLEKKK